MQEARIILAIEAIYISKKMSIRRTTQTYNVPKSTLIARIKGRVVKPEKRDVQYNLTLAKEETLIRYILDLDSRGFPPRIDGVKDIADLLLTTRYTQPTGK
jgi:hypothetical protein